VDQHNKQIKNNHWPIESPKTQHKKYSIHLNQIISNLQNLFEHFEFTCEIKGWKDSQVTTICI
jgi:hypothetical protein